MLTKIPHFKEVIIMSFQCSFCQDANTQVQYGGAIEEKGAEYTCTLNSKEDYARQIVRSEYASIRLHELDLELPNTSKKGVLTTLEGLMQRIMEDLSMEQPVRKVMNPEVYAKLEDLISKMKQHLSCYDPLTISIDDVSGNSFIESLSPPSLDPKLKVRFYTRSKQQNECLGLFDNKIPIEKPNECSSDIGSSAPSEIGVFKEPCYSCGVPSETRMCILKIPNFQEIIVMSTVCERCGYKNNEVKPSGSIAAHGKLITLSVKNSSDLSREVIKSDSCKIRIPELQFESILSPGKYTTIEGLLLDFKSHTPFLIGDSVSSEKKEKFARFVESLEKGMAIELGHELTLILDDPLGNTFVQSLNSTGDDLNLTVTEYVRSYEQNEEFGINDLKVENY
ncbi:nucleolar zinc-finger protein, variant 2 [Basidiobolus ranarum]